MVHSASLPRTGLKVILGTVLGFTLALVSPVLSAEPGQSFTEHCATGWESVTVTPTEVTAVCAPIGNPSSSASAFPSITPSGTASPTPTASAPTPAPSAAPTVTPSTPPIPSPSPLPTATPPSTATPVPPSDCDTITGYGSGATGGTNVVTASSFAQLRNLSQTAGNHVVLQGAGVWDGNGAQVRVANNVTIDGTGSSVVIKDAWFLVRSDNVIFDGFTIATGDESVSVDSDPISLNGASNVAINRMTLLWGMDVGGLTILNASTDVTVQCSIIGEGLYRSKHSESGDNNGHSYALNIAGLSTSAIPERITVYRNLLTTSHSRMPRIHGARLVDVVNNVIYNGTNSAEGVPASLNYVGNYLRPGPASAGVGISDANFYCVWRTQTGGVFGSVAPASVYESGNVLEGTRRSCMTASQRASTPFPLSVTPEPASLDVLDDVGSGPYRDRLINNVRNGAGQFLNGVNGPAPAIAW